MVANVMTSSIVTNLPALPDTTDPEAMVQLTTVYTAIQALHQEMTRTSRLVCTFDTNASPGQLLNVYSVGGNLHARLANATTNAKPCAGFCGASPVVAGAVGEVIYNAVNIYTPGLTAGTLYYLGLVDGAYTSVKPVTVGNIIQPIGYAQTANTIFISQNNNWVQI